MLIISVLAGVILVMLLIILFLFLDFRKSIKTISLSEVKYTVNKISEDLPNEFSRNRLENAEQNKNIREELRVSLKDFSDLLANTLKDNSASQKDQLEGFARILDGFKSSNEEKLALFQQSLDSNSKENRKELKESLEQFNNSQKDNFLTLHNRQSDQNKNTSDRLDQMRDTLERKMKELQEGNEKKLDAMRETVDEKLQKTLESRLGESFKLVSERLEAVHKGLGDMQHLVIGVGDLKKVLTNVKTRGVLGEFQLENLLEQLLTIEQYGKNVKTKSNSNAQVEFAVKLPGRNEKEKSVWLPIDSKFPKEDFELLQDAYDQANPELFEELKKTFAKGMKKCAADIRNKYIDPPNTTEFAILFLPFESLYAEVLRIPGLFESIQREYKVVITGPTTLSALLNSLQMGFRTLAIERRSSEVWDLLGAVKTEFGNFGLILEKTQKKLKEASNVVEQAEVRSRVIERKLKSVQQLPKDQSIQLLGESENDLEEEKQPEIDFETPVQTNSLPMQESDDQNPENEPIKTDLFS